ncbi:MAG: type II toxin-antitoxin system VapC family toxin [Beijerinckiaceae bacterium]|nr:type II toxin-antitoxin system VapC family toxin [Beijerinckiaceae bacterium]
MYLADTNVISEARRGTREAVSWLRAAQPSAIYLSVLTLGEVMKGVAMKERRDRRASGHLSEWLQKLRREHADRILPITDAIAIEWGRIAALRPRGDVDGLIAATAIVHGLILVTRNAADFDGINVSIVDPWDRG